MDMTRMIKNSSNHRRWRSIRVCTALLIVAISGVVQPSGTPSAFACSLAVFPANTPVVRFTGKAVRHQVTIEGTSSSTYEWTFLVKSWDRSSAGKRRKSGSSIRISVVESPLIPPTTTPLPGGAVPNSCYGIQLGVTTEFHRNRIYDVTAIVHSGTTSAGDEFIISHTVGLLTPGM
jgi:hypothetical protein